MFSKKEYKVFLIVFALFCVFRLSFSMINWAEWGDSYRILRAANYIQKFDYPLDEKRPPLFSALLSVRPNVDPIIWGRIVMFVVSCLTFLIFGIFSKKVLGDNIPAWIFSMVFFGLNPDFFYWSLRIYADVFLLLIVLAAFLISVSKNYTKLSMSLILGMVSGLAILTRFEGYILAFSMGIPLLVFYKKYFKNFVVYVLGVCIFWIPFLIWRNPLNSTYISEPSNRVYNYETVLAFGLSFLFLSGFLIAPILIVKSHKIFTKNWKEYFGIICFFILEFLLALLWPAAIPRLMVQIVPVIAILCGYGLSKIDEIPKKYLIISTIILGIIYTWGQLTYRLQFLIVSKPLILVVLVLSLLTVISVCFKKPRFAQLFILVTILMWTTFTVWNHSTLYKSISQAAKYSVENLSGKFYYNDVSGVADFYLNSYGKSGLSGEYLMFSGTRDIKTPVKADYLLVTNEHNPSMSFDSRKLPFLVKEKEFIYNVSDTKFHTVIYRINK